MLKTSDSVGSIQSCLDRLQAGDDSARDELIRLALGRMERLARKMLGAYPGVRRWEWTDDVLQNALIRLSRSLKVVNPETPRSFFNFAAQQIRRELIDLARRHGGPQGIGANHDSRGGEAAEPAGSAGPLEDTHEPARLAIWTEFHRAVERLPDPEREVFNLLWYEGMTQLEAGHVLGISERTVKWRWRGAKLQLQALLGDGPHRP